MYIRVNNTTQYNKIIKLTWHKFNHVVTDFHKETLRDRHPVFIHTRLCTSKLKHNLKDAKVITFAEIKDIFKL